MARFQESAAIQKKERLSNEIVRFTLIAPKIAAAASAGQFVMVRSGNGYDPLLRRPFSIHNATGDGLLQLMFKVVGKGTRILANLEAGQHLEMFGPLGRGFSPAGTGNIVLVGGGMGIAPLYFLAKQYLRPSASTPFHILLGARTAQELEPLARDFLNFGCPVQLATDDGSAGHHGFVIDLLKNEPCGGNGCLVFSCGPYPMMRAVAKTCRDNGWNCQVSLETLMACGLGACLGCAIPAANPADPYLHVCSDGPVFNSEEIAWL